MFKTFLTESKNAIDGIPHTNAIRDGTSFMVNISLERSNAGYCYDGRDSGMQIASFQLKGTPIYQRDDDTYYKADSSIPPPS